MFKYTMKLWMGGLILVLLAAAYLYAAPAQDERLKSLEDKVSYIGPLQVQIVTLQSEIQKLSGAQVNTSIPQTGSNDLQTKLNDMQTRLDKITAEMDTIKTGNASNEQAIHPAEIALAQNVLDTAGFHEMAATLSQTKTIDPSYIGTVTRVKKVLSATQWPASLADQSKAFIAELDGFAAALQANNGNDAADWVNKVHAGEHGFSKAIDNYLNSAGAPSQGQPVNIADVALAQNVLDTAGFHTMADTLTKNKVIDPNYLTTVIQVKKVFSATQWPASLADQNKAFISQLNALVAALQSGNSDQAVDLVNKVHAAGHAFSKAIDGWLSNPTAQ